MSHEALYRKYRPGTFSELMGQDAINRTLTNAIATKQVAHAYLFCGPRGTGKTSTARLLAKTLNCATGGTEPCNRCASCEAVSLGASMDVIEIDAASNRGIDDIRTIREQVRFASVGGGYKIYIIDECHQLSDPAVNAFLKTLEEPPDNVVFVLATTEAHKVLPTIQSRCQRFDFQRIPTPVLMRRLVDVARAERISVSDVALQAIARRAAGGLRDGLTLLDQVASLATDDGAVPDDVVLQVLGEVRSESVLAMGEAILASDVVGLWRHVASLLGSGYDPQTVLQELMSLVRNLLVLQVAPDRALDLDIAESMVAALSDQAARWTQPDLIYCLELLNETAERLRRATHDQIWLEAGLARLCQRRSIASLLDLETRIEALEQRLGAAGPVPVRTGNAAAPAAKSVGRPLQPPATPVTPSLAEPGSRPEAKQPAVPAIPAVAEPVSRPEAKQPAVPAIPAVAEPVTVAQPEPKPAPIAPPAVVDDTVAPAAESVWTEPVETLWQRAIEAIAERHPPTAAILREATLGPIDPESLRMTLGFSLAIHKESVEKSPKRITLIEGGLAAIFGRPLRLKCVDLASLPARRLETPPQVVERPVAPPIGEPAAPATPTRSEPPASPESRIDHEPVVLVPAADVVVADRPAPPSPSAESPAGAPGEDEDLVTAAIAIFKGKLVAPGTDG